jgi:uncharacterized membrane protein YidH (DUF202 family)
MNEDEVPGLQRERTLLAWDRTALALLVAAALLLRAGGSPYIAIRHLPAMFAMAVGGATFVVTDLRYRRGKVAGQVARTRHLAVVVLAVMAVGIDATILVVAGG